MRNPILVSLVMLLPSMFFLTGCASGTQPKPVAQAPAEEKTIDRAATLIAQQLVAGLSQGAKPKTAVLDLTDTQGNVTELGRLLREEIAGKLMSTGHVSVVERLKLQELLDELALQQSGVMNEATAKRLGQQSGAEAVVFGSMADLNSIVKLNVRLVDVEKGNVLASGGAEITKDAAVSRLMAQKLSGPKPGGTSQKPATAQAEASNIPTFVSDLFRLQVTSAQKVGDRVTLSLMFENLSRAEVRVTCFLNETFLQDDKGEVWVHEFEGIDGLCIRGVTLTPGGKAKSRLSFSIKDVAHGSREGKQFTLRWASQEPPNLRYFVIKGIKVE